MTDIIIICENGTRYTLHPHRFFPAPAKDLRRILRESLWDYQQAQDTVRKIQNALEEIPAELDRDLAEAEKAFAEAEKQLTLRTVVVKSWQTTIKKQERTYEKADPETRDKELEFARGALDAAIADRLEARDELEEQQERVKWVRNRLKQIKYNREIVEKWKEEKLSS